MKSLALVPPTRHTLPESVSQQLEASILGPDLGPGDRLPAERDLAGRLGVSRLVVREALRALVERGLIEVRPGVGTFVAAMTEDAVTGPLGRFIRRHDVETAHLFDVRRALEPRMAAAAARALESAALERMRENVARTFQLVSVLDEDDAPGGNDEVVEAFAWADLEFHQLLARAGDNPLYSVLLDPLLDPLLAIRLQGARLPGAAAEAAHGHRSVLDAVERRDADAAAHAMNAHLDQVAAWLEPSARPTAPADRMPDSEEDSR